MNPGDLVRVTQPCVGMHKTFVSGELGIIIGWGQTYSGIRRNDLYRIMFPSGIEVFTAVMLELVNEIR